MFRASVRSVSDHLLREHVCFSCLARGFGGSAPARLFHSTPLSRAKSGDGDTEGASNQSFNDALQNITESLQTLRPENKEKLDEHDEPTNSVGKRRAPGGRKRQMGRTRKSTATPRSRTRRSSAGGAPVSPGIRSSLHKLVESLEVKPEKKPYFADQKFPQPPRFICGAIESRHHGKVQSGQLKVKKVTVKAPPPVPQLSFGLQRVLFNPGVYHLRDPRSNVFNFDPYLGSIMPVTEFDFTALKEYITSSKDDVLRNMAIDNGKKYVGSSSSMTSVLSHFHYLLSAWRPINVRMLSQGFSDPLRSFTRIMRAPAAMFLRYQDGVYAIDADKEFDSATILMNLGKSMEKLLTLPKKEFERYRRSHENKITAEEESSNPEAYHYSMMGDFMMRSQLDAFDPRLPGTGMFDLKTRAVVSIRMDAQDFEKGLGYHIKSRFGMYESYEREYFDMIRSAFLKYSLQVRIGRMDGIFVAFHNIERIFGFQYVSLPEMDEAIHGQSDTSLGDSEFRLSLKLWNEVLDKATAKFPGRSLRFHFETRDTSIPFMYIFAEPVTDDEINAIQTKNKAEIDAYQQRILKLEHSEDNQDATSDLSANESESESESESKDIEETATEETSYKETMTEEIASEETASEETASEDDSTDPEIESVSTTDPNTENREILAMTLLIKNHVNRKAVERPVNFTSEDSWTVEYELSELTGRQVNELYTACTRRRQKYLSARTEDSNFPYLRKLQNLAGQGRKHRKEQDKLDKKHGVIVLDPRYPSHRKKVQPSEEL